MSVPVYSNCFCIDLEPLKTKSELEKFLISTNLTILGVDCIWDAKNGKKGTRPLKMIWIDKVTIYVIAYLNDRGEYKFTKEYLSWISNQKPIKYGDFISHNQVDDSINLSVDDILDKINKSGIKSLTNEELNTLKFKLK